MSRTLILTLLTLLCTGCGGGGPAPAPRQTTSTATTAPDQAEQADRDKASGTAANGSSSASSPAAAGPRANDVRDLAARYVVSDGQGGWRPDERAATELEKLGPAAVNDLLPLMKDSAAPVRRGAAFYLLGQFDPSQSDQVAAFSRLLDDEDQTLRGFGLSAVKLMRREDQISAVPRLTAMLDPLREPTAENRAAIARLIGTLKRDASSSADPLAAAAADDPDAKVRAACLAAIVQVAEPGEVVAPLANGLSDPDPSVRLVAAARLRTIGPPAAPAARQLAAALGDDDQRVREAAAEALIRIGQPAVEPTAKQLASKNVEAKKLALACLAKIGPDARSALPAIKACREDADALVRQLAEAAIRRIEM